MLLFQPVSRQTHPARLRCPILSNRGLAVTGFLIAAQPILIVVQIWEKEPRTGSHCGASTRESKRLYNYGL